jgi:hypothetical protein
MPDRWQTSSSRLTIDRLEVLLLSTPLFHVCRIQPQSCMARHGNVLKTMLGKPPVESSH